MTYYLVQMEAKDGGYAYRLHTAVEAEDEAEARESALKGLAGREEHVEMQLSRDFNGVAHAASDRWGGIWIEIASCQKITGDEYQTLRKLNLT